MWAVDNNGNYTQIYGDQWIQLSPQSNSIRFTARFDGFICAYVVGDFNNWEQSDEFKLTWKMDYNDKVLKLTKDITFENGLEKGIYKYCYVLVDDDGNEFFISNIRNGDVLQFDWIGLKKELEIKSSEDYVVLGVDVELVAIKNEIYGKREIEDVVWEVEPKLEGISIKDGVLNVSKEIGYLKKILVSCYDEKANLKAAREFKIIKKDREGVLVHFIKSDENYSGDGYTWDLWAYGEGSDARSVQLNNQCDFGKIAEVNHKNVIARKKCWGFGWMNEWSEQTYSFQIPEGKSNCYIVYGETRLFGNLKDVINNTTPRIECAIMDERNKIIAYLSHEPLIGTEFEVYVNGKRQLNINAIVKDKKKKVIFTNLPLNIYSNDLVEIRATNMFLPCKVLMRNWLDDFYYKGDDMGIRFNKEEVSLRVWAPTALKVELLIYDDYNSQDELPEKVYNMKNDYISGTFYTNISRKENENKYYMYRLYFNALNREGKVFTQITYAVDPYAVGVCVNGKRGVLLDLNSKEAKPKDWEKVQKPSLVNKEDSIIYEMHIRDFTISENSGVKEELKGKYLGVVQSGTTYEDNELNVKVSTGIDHLKELGITHVHILPFFDFASVDERYVGSDTNRNWGYDPQNYNVPEGSYSSDPFNPFVRIKETRQMINEFHKNGLRVVMDMVYNHMCDTGNFDKIVPGYYFRSNYLGNYSNGSGCGNELATEKPMVRKFVLDSILHWINNYHIDGLRFDLMELMDFDTMKEILASTQKIDPSIIIYGEPWKGGDSPLNNGTYRGRQKNQEFSIFNDMFRDVIRGNNGPGNGFVNGDQHSPYIGWNLIEGIKGSINGLTSKPKESINYIDAHDNYTLWDHIEKSQNMLLANGSYRLNIPQNPFDNVLVKENVLAMSIILTSQGIPFVQGGTEILRTKNGDHNSYKSGDIVNAIHWEDKARYKKVFDFYKGLIRLRKEHPAFKIESDEDVTRNFKVGFVNANEKAGAIVAHLSNHVNGDRWKDIVIVYNATSIDNYDVNGSLPYIEEEVWHIVVNNEKAGLEIIESVQQGRVPPLKAHSIMILHN